MITRNRILFIVGVLTVVTPFLGLPSSYEIFLSIIFGLAVASLALFYARDKRLAESGEAVSESDTVHSFVQNQPVPQPQADDFKQDQFSNLGALKDRSSRIKTSVN